MSGARRHKKQVVETCRSVSVFTLKRHNVFSRGQSGGTITWSYWLADPAFSVSFFYRPSTHPMLSLSYDLIDHWDLPLHIDQDVRLVTAPCQFGGVRYWFLCPRYCGMRVGKLYLPAGAERFGCRRCHNLTYRSCQEHDDRVNKLARDPELFAEYVHSKQPGLQLLGYRAAMRILRKDGLW